MLINCVAYQNGKDPEQQAQTMKKLLIAGVATTAVCAIISACGGGGEPLDITKGTVIQNATVANTRDGFLALGMSVVIDEGKIQKIMAGTAIRISGTAQAINASSKYLVLSHPVSSASGTVVGTSEIFGGGIVPVITR